MCFLGTCMYHLYHSDLNIVAIPKDKRNATVKLCHVYALHVAHTHELHKLIMTRILSILICKFLANIHVHILTDVTIFSFIVIYRKF